MAQLGIPPAMTPQSKRLWRKQSSGSVGSTFSSTTPPVTDLKDDLLRWRPPAHQPQMTDMIALSARGGGDIVVGNDQVIDVLDRKYAREWLHTHEAVHENSFADLVCQVEKMVAL